MLSAIKKRQSAGTIILPSRTSLQLAPLDTSSDPQVDYSLQVGAAFDEADPYITHHNYLRRTIIKVKPKKLRRPTQNQMHYEQLVYSMWDEEHDNLLVSNAGYLAIELTEVT